MDNETQPTREMCFLAGAAKMCPGCKIEKEEPSTHLGFPSHELNGRPYECHASESWAKYFRQQVTKL